MKELIELLKQFSLEDAIRIEESDRQFLAIKNLFLNLNSRDYFLPLIITNSLLSYQLSSSWENYWEEFCLFASSYNFPKVFNPDSIEEFFIKFLPLSKWNKRLLNMKIPRLTKTKYIWENFLNKEEFYYDNLSELQTLLTKVMKQKRDDKTILFALKMFHYWARIKFDKFLKASYDIWMPIDSRIIKIENIFNVPKIDSQIFWQKISKEINIPCLHLDAILWVRCNDFICLNI